MAAEAVKKIKEAEEAGKERVRAANEQAKQMIAEAGKEGRQKNSDILAAARKERQALLDAAASRAGVECETLDADGEKQRQNILSPSPANFDRAVNLIVERIVNV